MTDDPAQTWRTTLRAELMAARKTRDTTRVSALRTALAAIDNAETPDDVEVQAPPAGPIAGAAAGLGATEVARRELSDTQIRALIRADIDERLSAADEISAAGHSELANTLRAEAAVLADLLRDV